MKRAIVLMLWCALLAAGTRAQIAVSGNLQTLGVQNATGANTFVRFTLSNYSGVLPQVMGSAAIVADHQDFHVSGTGTISGSIYGNDTISPAGTTYQVCVYTNGSQFSCAMYSITSVLYPSGFNLNTAQPIVTTSPTTTQVAGARSYPFVQGTASTTWVINHNFNDSHPIVTCFNTSGAVIYPDSVVATDANDVTVVFASAQTGSCNVISAGYLNLATNVPNAIISNPAGPQNISGVLSVAALTVTASNKIQHAETFSGPTADVQITNCLAAVGSGGTCDARGYGATTQTLAANVSIGTNQTLIFDLTTKLQAASSSVNAFSVALNGHLSGVWFDCGNQPSYSGNVFTIGTTSTSDNANSWGVSDFRVTCSGVTTGNAFLLSTAASQSIAFFYARNGRVIGLNNGALLTATGNSFVNGNHFVDIIWNAQNTAGLHFTNNNGQLNGNICNPCSFEGSGSQTAMLFDGTSGSNDQAYQNLWFGDVWDTTTPFTFTNTKALNNLAIGRFDGTISDPNGNNNWWDMQSEYLNLSSSVLISSAANGLQVRGGTSFDFIIANNARSQNNYFGDDFGNFTAHASVSTQSVLPSLDLVFTETTPPAGVASKDVCYGDSTAHAVKCSYNNGTFYPNTQTIASGTAAMTTALIGSGACGTTVTVSASNVATTDAISWSFNASVGANPGVLTVQNWVTSGNVNFAYCNPTAAGVTPSAVTLNWRVTR